MVHVELSLAYSVFKYKLLSLSGGIDCFGLKSSLGIQVNLVALVCSSMSVANKKKVEGPRIIQESGCIANHSCYL